MNNEKNSTPTTAIEGVPTSQRFADCGFNSSSILPHDQSARVAFFEAHDVHPERGEYWGDGVARTLDDSPFEPLSWGHTLVFGRSGK